MSQQIAVRIPKRDLAVLDRAIEQGRFPNRAAALREGLALLLRDQHEREIDEAYARAYGAQPQEEWVGEVGLGAFAAFVAAEVKDEEPL